MKAKHQAYGLLLLIGLLAAGAFLPSYAPKTLWQTFDRSITDDLAKEYPERVVLENEGQTTTVAARSRVRDYQVQIEIYEDETYTFEAGKTPKVIIPPPEVQKAQFERLFQIRRALIFQPWRKKEITQEAQKEDARDLDKLLEESQIKKFPTPPEKP